MSAHLRFGYLIQFTAPAGRGGCRVLSCLVILVALYSASIGYAQAPDCFPMTGQCPPCQYEKFKLMSVEFGDFPEKCLPDPDGDPCNFEADFLQVNCMTLDHPCTKEEWWDEYIERARKQWLGEREDCPEECEEEDEEDCDDDPDDPNPPDPGDPIGGGGGYSGWGPGGPFGPGGGNSNGGCLYSTDPVNLAIGAKAEFAHELYLSIVGEDFTVTRHSTSNPLHAGAGLVGNNQAMSPFVYVIPKADDGPCGTAWCTGNWSITIADLGETRIFRMEQPELFHYMNEPPPAGLTLIHQGPGTDSIVAAFAQVNGTNYAVWRHIQPGGMTIDYYREWREGWGQFSNAKVINPKLIGLRLQEVDPYGNRRFYIYQMFGEGQVPRLDRIIIGSDIKTTIHFSWNGYGSKNLGRLKSISVDRVITIGSPPAYHVTDTHRIEYRYIGDLGIPSNNNDLGTQGDLVRVRYLERMDDGSARERILLERYHNPTDYGCGPTRCGQERQLKMLITPDQVEHFAREGGYATLADAAVSLMGIADNTPVLGAPLHTFAAKYIPVYEDTDKQRVKVQYVNTGCGCGAGSSPARRKLTYEYWEYSPILETVQIQEYIVEGATEVLRHTTYHDLIRLGPDNAPYLQTMAIVEPPASGGRMWVHHYEYHGLHQAETRYYTPAALDTYTPGTAQSPPVYTASATSGLIRERKYNDLKLPTETWIGSGTNNFHLVERITYSDEEDHVLKFLPHTIQQYRVAGDGNSPDEDIETTVIEYTFHQVGTFKIASRKVVVEAELASENGPGATYWTVDLYDEMGLNIWTRAEDGALSKRDFDLKFGKPTAIIRNAAPEALTHPFQDAGANLPGWGRTPNGALLDGPVLTTEFTFNEVGRLRSTTVPGNLHNENAGVTSYLVRETRPLPGSMSNLKHYVEVHLPQHGPLGGSTINANAGPAAVIWYDAADRELRASDYVVTNSHYGFDVMAYGLAATESSRRTSTYGSNGQLLQSRVWHRSNPNEDNLPLVGEDAYYETRYEYDSRGRLERIISATDTVTQYEYDVLDRLKAESVGIVGETPTLVRELFYDSSGALGDGVGNGNVTRERQHINGSEFRDTIMTYDHRDRLVKTQRPASPHEMIAYDNLDRVIATAAFASLPATNNINDPSSLANRLSYAETRYSQRGLPYVTRIAIKPTDASPEFLESHIWYDPAGRAVCAWTPGGPAAKTTYDGVGAAVVSYTCDSPPLVPGVPSGYDAAYNAANGKANVASDTVLQQVESKFNAVGLVDLVTVRRRTHDASGTGALITGNSVATHTATYYDRFNRVSRSIVIGTNHESFKSNTPEPTWWPPDPWDYGSVEDVSQLNQCLVTQYTYDKLGRLSTVTDPEGVVMRTYYDAMGRTIATVENYHGNPLTINWNTSTGRWSASNHGSQVDRNRVTTLTYDGHSNVVFRVADLPGSQNNQITKYEYGVSPGSGSALHSNDLLHRVRYPDKITGEPGDASSHRVAYTYNRLGEVTSITDQRGIVREFEYDAAGRQITDRVATGQNWGDVDDTVRALRYEYDAAGRRTRAYSQGSAGVLNDVVFEYNAFNELTDIWQNPTGAAVTSGSNPSPRVRYTYESPNIGLPPHRRLKSITYPAPTSGGFGGGGGAVLNYGYGEIVGGIASLDQRIGRVRSLGTSVDLVKYTYLGTAAAVIVDYVQPDVRLDRTVAYNGSWTTGTYPGWDRFGRPRKIRWVDGDFLDQQASGPSPWIPQLVEYAYEYDKRGNVTKRHDDRPGLIWPHRQVQLSYDDLHRLTEAKFGAPPSQGSGFLVAPISKAWQFDRLGNWMKVLSDADPSGNWGAEEDRTHNKVNELTSRSPDSGPTLNLTFDWAGNIKSQKVQGTSGTVTISYTHDAWNRLARVKYDGVLRSEFRYNALHHRVMKTADVRSAGGAGGPNTDTPPDGTIDQRRLLFYDASWRMIEERIDDTFTLTGGGGGGGAFVEDRRVQYFWGVRGTDDIVLHRVNNNPSGSGGGSYDKNFYHLTDTQFSTLVIVDQHAKEIERISYDAYGRPRHHPLGDLDGDGMVRADEHQLMFSMGAGTVADLNRDGVVNGDDRALMGANLSISLAHGVLSLAAVDNQLGYAGYIYHAEMRTYLARHRWFDPVLGRWLQRDPAGYVDGMNLYLYGLGSPFVFVDPWGLWSDPCQTSWWDAIVGAPRRGKDALDDLIQNVIILAGNTLGLVPDEHIEESSIAQAVAARGLDGPNPTGLVDAVRIAAKDLGGVVVDGVVDHGQKLASGDPETIVDTVLSIATGRALLARARARPIASAPSPSTTTLLQQATDRQSARLARDPSLAKGYLSESQYKAGQRHAGVARMNYGHAIEKMVAQDIGARHPDLFKWNPGGGPDFTGIGLRNSGRLYDITTPGGVPSHMARPYGSQLNFATYERPLTFTLFPK